MNKFNPKVSIIIPVYNGSNYVEYAIESALNQTYKNIEIIVVNDGSNDGDKTREIVKSFGKKVKYFEKENGGVSTALNYGIKKMIGEYFSWLSHDDLYLPNKVESQIDYLINNKLTSKKIILFSDYGVIDGNSKFLSNRIIDHELMQSKPEYSLLRAAINGLTLLIPKNAFNEIGLFKEELKAIQDYELWHRMMKKYKFIHMDEVLVQTRVHPNQTTNTSPNVISEGNEFWTFMIKDLKKEDMIRLEGSVENFYLEMYKFLLLTPYKETTKYVNDEYKKITGKDIEVEKEIVNNLYSNNPIKKVFQIIKYEGLNNLAKRIANKLRR